MLSLTMTIAVIGVMLFIIAGVKWASMQKLLKEGEFTPQEKVKGRIKVKISSVYWMIVTAIFLVRGFIINDWTRSWIIWPIAGVLFAAVMAVFNLFDKKEQLP